MVQINFALKEVNCKVVYYGPGMSGKTTNLEVVHQKAPPQNKGELTSIATEGDRTLFFDFMPLDLGNIAGMRTKFQLYTVPGQVYYNSTRKLVLQGVDGIIFVADSQEGKMEENLESLENLRNNLAEYGKKLDEIPMVVQWNKRDMPNVMDAAYMNEKLNPMKRPSFEAVATTGEGVFPTLKALSGLVLESLSKDRSRAGRSAPAKKKKAPARPAPAMEPAARKPTVPPQQQVAAATGKSAEDGGPLAHSPGAEEDPQHLRGGLPTPEGRRRRRPDPRRARRRSPRRRDRWRRRRRRGRPPTGSSSFTTSPPETRKPAAPERPPVDASPIEPQPGKRPQATPPNRGRDSRAQQPRSQGQRAHGPRAQNPRVRKYVIQEERGSPVFLVLLGAVIMAAVGVILYSFNMF